VADVTLTEVDDGARSQVRVGDVVTIRLPENSAAGYRWSAAAIDESPVVVEGPRYQPAGGGVGSAGTSVWTLRATRPGQARVALKKARSWEADTPSERFAVILDIRE
jgi:predicted secreted protein